MLPQVMCDEISRASKERRVDLKPPRWSPFSSYTKVVIYDSGRFLEEPSSLLFRLTIYHHVFEYTKKILTLEPLNLSDSGGIEGARSVLASCRVLAAY